MGTRRIRKATLDDVDTIVEAMADLRRARDRLVSAGAGTAARRVRAVLKSADGARRHATRAWARQTRDACSLRVGWDFFNDEEIQRDDELALFDSDDDARAHIRACARCRMDLMVEADGLPVEPLLAARDS
jgi:hypothetical protein